MGLLGMPLDDDEDVVGVGLGLASLPLGFLDEAVVGLLVAAFTGFGSSSPPLPCRALIILDILALSIWPR